MGHLRRNWGNWLINTCSVAGSHTLSLPCYLCSPEKREEQSVLKFWRSRVEQSIIRDGLQKFSQGDSGKLRCPRWVCIFFYCTRKFFFFFLLNVTVCVPLILHVFVIRKKWVSCNFKHNPRMDYFTFYVSISYFMEFLCGKVAVFSFLSSHSFY